MEDKNNWTNKFFNKLYWDLFMCRTDDEIIKEGEVIKKLILSKTSESSKIDILDVCCGVGDIAQYLSNVANMTGIEISKDYIEKSATLAKNVNIYHDSALDLNLNKQFDVVYNWYSSFAYFSNLTNKKLLTNCFKWTKKDGVFLMEIYNSYAVLKNFVETKNYTRNFEGSNYYTERQSSIDWKNRYLNQTWQIVSDKGYNKKYDTFTILYLVDELCTMFENVGFKDLEVFGRDVNNNIEEFNIASPRLIIKAYK